MGKNTSNGNWLDDPGATEDDEISSVRPEQRLLCTTEEAADILAISRTQVYRLMNSDDLRSVKIGARRLIPRSVLVEYVNDLLLAS